MNLFIGLILLSSLSFLIYGLAYFKSTNMKSEFKRFKLEKYGTLTAVLEIFGSIGLLVGLMNNIILLISAGGLGLLMLLGIVVRLKIKDSLLAISPAFFFMILNGYIFYKTFLLFY